jgi:hypothetical protein
MVGEGKAVVKSISLEGARRTRMLQRADMEKSRRKTGWKIIVL